MSYTTNYRLAEHDFANLLRYFDTSLETVSKDDFDQILAGNIKIKQYKAYFDGVSRLYAKDFLIRSITNVEPEQSKYDYISKVKRSVCYLDKDLENSTLEITGRHAYFIMLNILKKYYSSDEINEIFKNHSLDADNFKSQLHYNYPADRYRNKVLKFDNCAHYDINSAHGDAIKELFPRAEADITRLYEERKINPENKKILNYFVGYLCCTGNAGTYRWIVDRTSKKLEAAIKSIDTEDADILYVNTDAVIIRNAKPLAVSKKLGDFKLEYFGPVYVYSNVEPGTSPYQIFQCGDEIKGSCLKAVRDFIDLSEGKIVTYNRIKVNNYYDFENLKFENVEVIEL